MIHKFISFPWGRLVCLLMILICSSGALLEENLPASILGVGFLFAFVALLGIAVFRRLREHPRPPMEGS